MRISPKEFRLLAWMAAVLLASFCWISVTTYLQARETIRASLVGQVMPLAGDLVIAAIAAAPPANTITLDDPLVARWLAVVPPAAAGKLYFTDATGKLAGAAYPIRDTAGLQQIADRILNRDSHPTRLEYRQGRSMILLASRYLPELDWYLVQERDLSNEVRPARNQMALHLALGGGVTLLAVLLVAWAASRYQLRNARLGATDPVTGLANHQSFEILLEQSVRDMQRTRQPLSLVQFEIDGLHDLVDSDGRLAADHVVYSVAQLANELVRSSDIMARWTNEGFIILLRDCPPEVALRTAETLRSAVDQHDFGIGRAITLCLGVAACPEEELTLGFLRHCHEALALAQSRGRGQIAVAEEVAA